MKIRRSKRAEILSQLLPYITTDNYDHQGRFWIFGAQSFWEAYSEIATPEDKQEDTSVSDAAIEFANDAKHHAGRTQLAARASLSAAPRFKTNATKSLTPEQILELRIALEKVVPGPADPSGKPRRKHRFRS